MSRSLVRASATDSINIGDVTTARFEALEIWSMLIFMRVASIDATAESTIFAKWDASATQIRFQIDNGTSPVNISARINGTNVLSSGGDFIAESTWYLLTLTNDGASGLNLWIHSMDGSSLTSYGPLTDTHPGDGTLTGDIQLGRRVFGSADWFDGDVAHASYFSSEFNENKILEYLRFPAKVSAEEGSNCIFYLPLGLGSPEQDLSGNQNDGTLAGTPPISPMPPTGLMTPIRASMPVIEEAGVAGNPWNYYAQMQ